MPAVHPLGLFDIQALPPGEVPRRHGQDGVNVGMVRPVLGIPGNLDGPEPALDRRLDMTVIHQPGPCPGQLPQSTPQGIPWDVPDRQGQEQEHGPMLPLHQVQDLAQLERRSFRPPGDTKRAKAKLAEIGGGKLFAPVGAHAVLEPGGARRRFLRVLGIPGFLVELRKPHRLHLPFGPRETVVLEGHNLPFGRNCHLQFAIIRVKIHVQPSFVKGVEAAPLVCC